MKLIKISLLLFVFTIVGCGNNSGYKGDGQLIDNGTLNANERYRLNLGSIDLGRNGKYKYSVAGLPKDDFVFGMEIKSQKIIDKPLDIKANVAISIIDSQGQIVVSENALISDWVWSIPVQSKTSFVYRREGKGSYLSPKPEEAYSIELTVSEANSSDSSYKANFLGITGGWK